MQYTEISFPGLGLQFNPGRVLDLGFFQINYYGLIIAIGLALAAIYGLRRCNQFGFKQDDVVDGALMIIPIAIICTRLYYCAFQWEHYKDNPISILYIWEGGLAIYGGVIGAVIGIIAYCAYKKLSILAAFDMVGICFLIGQAIGRWGNFFNREAFGSATDGFLRMGLFNTYTQSWEYHHPTFLYESLWNATGFVLLHFLSKKRQYDGQVGLLYAAWYGLGRAFIEGLRTDSLYWGPFRVSQMLALVSFVIAAGILIFQAFRKHDPEKLYVNRVAKD
jgi:phosphatidylglycerol:prolipoprotein diacylglycerol transferase